MEIGYIRTSTTEQNEARQEVLMKELGDDTQDIIALVPESEILDYATKLRLITQGSGYFNREFDSFQEVPQFLQEKVLKENSLLNK